VTPDSYQKRPLIRIHIAGIRRETAQPARDSVSSGAWTFVSLNSRLNGVPRNCIEDDKEDEEGSGFRVSTGVQQ
jgi:hypothetical protein